MAESIINKGTQLFGGGKNPSSNATSHERIKTFFEGIQVVSSRINEVHCGILEKIKRYRNTSHKTVINCFVRQSGMTHFAKCVAFTLAETLVVMGIIGVVAALTIPNLNQSTGDREKVAKVKKIYSNLEDAFGRATAVYGPYDTWFNGLSTGEEKATRKGQRLTEFMKVSKDCGYVNENNNTCLKPFVETYSIITADGTGIGFYGVNDFIWVDIDGINKGKNNAGFDAFGFFLTNDGVIPEGCDGSMLMASGRYNNATCWIIRNGNMDYLKTDSQGKCPNGTTLDWTTNTTCK